MITEILPNGTPMDLRGFATAVIPNILIPQVFLEEEDRAFVERCCYDNLTLAGGTEPYQNDISSVLFKVFDQIDTIEFFLDKDGTGEVAALNDNTLGTHFPIGSFASQPLLTGFKLEWSKVLIAHGEGNYTIRTERVLLTGTDTVTSINYNLKTFSVELADNTIWIEWIQNGEVIDGLDYTGLNWNQAIRLPGFFGNKQEEFEEEVWKNSNYETFQRRNEQTFKWAIEIGPIPSCIANPMRNFKQGNTIQITDYNIKNFDYDLIRTGVRIVENNETKYDNNRQAIFNMGVTDRIENHIKINC